MMVGKVIGTGNGFRGVINYIVNGKKDEPNPERMSWVGFRNLLTEDPEDVPALMRATANQSARCKNPVYHYAISWHRDHSPSDELMRDIADATIEDMGLSEHQIFYGAHDDTAHRHIHIIVNRVHPETTRAWSNSNDYRRLEVSLRKQAEARGLPFVSGKFNDPEKFGQKGRRPRNGEYQAAVRHGKLQPKTMWSREDIKHLRAVLAPTFAEATSWDDLNARVTPLGFRIAPKGQGLIIEGADGFMKLSDLGKQVRIKSLEAAYGEAFSAYDTRRMPTRDEALRAGAGLFESPAIKIDDPVHLSRSQQPLPPVHSPNEQAGGDDDGAAEDAVRGEARRAWSQRRIKLPRPLKSKPNTSDDDPPVGGLPHPDADPTKLAYLRVRTARAELAKAKQERLQGSGDLTRQIDAQLELEEARRALDELLQSDRQGRPTPEEKPPRPAATPPTPPVSPRATAPVAPSLKDETLVARGEAFSSLRVARQAHDMAQALFNAGVITEEELKASADDVRRAAETLRPHLTLEEQLNNDIGDALRKMGRKHGPKKGGPSR